ncbi:transcriptional regulator [Candidatus Woesearchaeota archaeon]|nr:transcriptional regulator [Candidatus Woesearchaeota archaeon]MBW3016272.1 transcriptional regulator [Candidatus Woesearchaeota archaeon]
MTRRKDIVELLSKQAMTLRELTEWFHADAKDVLVDLQHVARSLKKRFVMDPSVCRNCGFVFKSREKLKRPSRCPECKNEKITEPVFSIES